MSSTFIVYLLLFSWKNNVTYLNTVKLVYKGHSREHENVAFMSSCPLFTCYNYMLYSLMGKLYYGVLEGRYDCIMLYIRGHQVTIEVSD